MFNIAKDRGAAISSSPADRTQRTATERNLAERTFLLPNPFYRIP